MSHFDTLLKELSPLLKTSLHVDLHGVCQLLINQEMSIQLSVSRTEEELLVAALLGEVAPGKFRENLFKKALQANYPAPSDGLLSFCEFKNQLSLFAFLPLRELSGEKIYAFLSLFTQKAAKWKHNVSAL